MRATTKKAGLAGALAVTAAMFAAASSTPATAVTGPGAVTFTKPVRVNDPALVRVGRTGTASTFKPSEPATIVGADGTRYVAYQSGSQLVASKDGGRSWKQVGGVDVVANHLSGSGCSSRLDAGDVELAADQGGRVYLSTLQGDMDAGTSGAGAGVEAAVVHSDDNFQAIDGSCASHQPFMVDREWMTAYTPTGSDSNHSHVYLSYHDFGPDSMWVNSSHDGGKTWGAPVNIINGTDAINDSACDTIPSGIAVDPNNGWVYVGWLAGPNAAANAATGCNYTQGSVFNNFVIAVSKDNGATWSSTIAFSGPGPTDAAPMDMSEIFGSMVVDRSGGVAIAFPAFLDGEYGAYYAYAPPPGNGKLTFSKPVKISPPEVHTAYFVRAVVGDAGRAAVTFLGSPVKNLPSTPANKVSVDGSDPKGPNCRPEQQTDVHPLRYPGKPCLMPKNAPWFLYVAQTTNGNSASPAFGVTRLRDDPVHVGDICTLGIFCEGADNRDLADTNDIRIDATGAIQVAYTAEKPDGSAQEIDFQCQQGGPGLLAAVTPAPCQADAPSIGAAVTVTVAKVLGAQSSRRLPATGSGETFVLPALLAAGVGLIGLRTVRRKSSRARRNLAGWTPSKHS